MTKPGSALVRFSLQGLIAALLLAFSAMTFASDPVWVRIHHQVTDPAIAGFARDANLADYGSFQWGQISASDADALERQGVRLTTSANPFELTLGEDRFDPLLAGERVSIYSADPAGDWHLVQFDGPVRPQWLQSLRATGAQVAQPLHPFSYFVWANSSQISAARSLNAVRWTGAMQPNWKVQPHLRKFGSEIRPTMALASAHVDSNRLWSDLSQFGQVHKISPLNRHFQLVHMDVPGYLYASVGELPAIYTVQYIRPETGPRGEMSNQSIVGNYDGSNVVFPGYATWLTATGYNGTGVIVGVVDGGIRTSHVDLVDRMVPCVPSGDSPTSCTTANDSHGTHVAGGVAGTGASGVTDGLGFLRGQGVAPGANIVQQRYGAFTGAGPGSMIPDGMRKIYRESALSGALLTNNSWGPTTTPQGYDIPTQQIDFISRDATPELPGHQPVLAVWSVMNGNGDSGGACAPSSLGSPDEAKNLFAVGSNSMQTTGGAQESYIFRVSPNSGHGPACDGRRAPHIVAPGCRTDSTSSGSDTAFGLACGTSMASPVVSGAVAVWAEKYIQDTSTDPSPALVKAVFTAAAQNLEGNPNADGNIMGHRPDPFQGYGRLDLDLVMNHGLELFTLDQTEVFTSVGQDWSIGLNAVNPSEPIRIMLAWTDAPGHGMGGTTPAWVNDLDLAVDAGGNTYLGNVIGGDGWSATGGSPDDRNNLEGVFLSPAQHQGAVTVTVAASDLQGDALDPYDPTTNRQDFALACYNCIIGDPTFSINLAPSIGEACVPDSGTADIPVTVSVGTIGVYTGTVALSASGEPAGVSTLFVPMSVPAPGSSDLTVSVDSTALAGSYPISVIGDDGTDINSREFTLNLDEYLASGPTLLNPGNGASDTSLTPAFSWDALAGVNDYQIQVATDAGFTSIVLDESVEGASFTPLTELNTGTEYFWRVRGENFCGGGEWSSTFSFTTRLEPVASFSATEFAFFIDENETDSANLVITNTGTGNLTFNIELDQPDSTVLGGGGHSPALDETLSIPNFSIDSPANGGSPAVFNIPAGIASRGEVIGLSFSGTVSGISGNGSWASDMCLRVTAPDGTVFDVGGFSAAIESCSINNWDFQGSGSNNDGTYSSEHMDAFAPPVDDQGDWTFSFVNGWNSTSAATMNWSDVTITLHKAPLPVCGDELTNVDWLSVAPLSGSIPQGDNQIVTVMVDSTGLIPNNYIGYLCVYTNDPSAAMVPMPVELTVTGDAVPVADITPALFDFTVPVDSLDADDLFIGNIGTATLTWDIHTAEAAPLGGIPYRSDSRDLGHAEVVSGTHPVYNLPQGSSRAIGQVPSGPVDHYVPGANRGGPISGDWNEGFEDIGTLPAAGWVIQNNSDPDGEQSWFQGDPLTFDAHQGPTSSYAAANYNNAAGAGVISTWLLTPEIELHNDTEIRFWTRSTESIGWEDRMQVRLSTSGGSADVGTGATDVGVFTEVLLDINPTYAASGYPEIWTEYVLTIEGLAESTSGRIAFRYFVESGGPDGDHSDYIGIDTFSVTQPAGPEPEACDVPATIGWLSVDQASGSTNPGNVSEVSVQIDTNGLTEGDYNAVLCVTTNDPSADLVEIPVSLTVVSAPEIPVADISPASFDFLVATESSDDDDLVIGNLGNTNLDWELVNGSRSVRTTELFVSGPVITNPGAGPGGTDLSLLQSQALGMDTLGAAVYLLSGGPHFRMADEMIVSEDWEISSITFYGYQSFTNPPSTFTGATVRIWDGPPNAGGSVIWGDTTTNVMASTQWINAYRVSETGTAEDRPIMEIVADTTGLELAAGSYWVDVQLAGSAPSGPWMPPITIPGETTTGNALQLTDTGWSAFTDGGTGTSLGIPFRVTGSEQIACFDPLETTWLNVNPDSGSVPAEDSQTAVVTVDTTGLAEGVYETVLCIATNDPEAALVTVPVTLEVVAQMADVSLADTVQTYTGSPLEVTVITDPPGLSVEVTYDGSPTPPTDADSYAVVVTVTEAGWSGGTTGTFIIEPATAQIMLSDLVQPYTGDPLGATVTTDPAGLNVNVTYNGDASLPSAIGVYTIEATIDEQNYVGSDSDTFEIVDSGPAALNIADQPSGNNVINSALTPALVVEVLDVAGDVYTADNDTVITVMLSAHASGAMLGGTLSATVVNGVAVFEDLTLDQPGTGFLLIVEDDQSELDAELTSPFNVLADEVFHDRFEQPDAP